jgi:hypothetical protein
MNPGKDSEKKITSITSISSNDFREGLLNSLKAEENSLKAEENLQRLFFNFDQGMDFLSYSLDVLYSNTRTIWVDKYYHNYPPKQNWVAIVKTNAVLYNITENVNPVAYALIHRNFNSVFVLRRKHLDLECSTDESFYVLMFSSTEHFIVCFRIEEQQKRLLFLPVAPSPNGTFCCLLENSKEAGQIAKFIIKCV